MTVLVCFCSYEKAIDYSLMIVFSGPSTCSHKISFYRNLQNLTLPKSTIYEKLFQLNESRYSSRRPLDLIVQRVNQTRYGLRSIQYEGAKIWNHLPNSIKSAENLDDFKRLIKTWEGPSCNCNFCKFVFPN